MIFHKVDPQSREWFYLRLGLPTASEFHKIVTPGGKLSKQADDYAHSLLAELMLGRPLENYQSEYMVRGQELEDNAIEAYEFETSREVSLGGFLTDDAGSMGCSPDRLVGDDGILEMKCPAPNTHVRYLLCADELAAEKSVQIQGQMLISGREWVDLVSFHPEMPIVVRRVKRDEKYIDILRVALVGFCARLLVMRADLEQKYGPFKPIEITPAPGPDTFGISDEDVDQMIQQGAIQCRE